MSAKKRSGFTLVELLTVVVIIGILVGLIVPAVNAARERARQAKCANNLHEIGLAVQSYISAKDRYPGYVSKRGTSWVVELLPFIGRSDIWKGDGTSGWRNTNSGDVVFIETFACPDDNRGEVPGQLSYAANDWVFTDPPVATPVYRTPEDLADVGGAAQVVMVGEKSAQAAKWDSTDAADLTFTWNSSATLGAFLSSSHPDLVMLIFCDGHGGSYRAATPASGKDFAQP